MVDVRFRFLPWRPRRRIRAGGLDGSLELAGELAGGVDDLAGLALIPVIFIAAVVFCLVVLPLLGVLLLPFEFGLVVLAGLLFFGLRLVHLRPWTLVVTDASGSWSEDVYGLRAARARRDELLGLVSPSQG